MERLATPMIVQAPGSSREGFATRTDPASGPGLVLGSAAALVLANLRYWGRLSPLVRQELRRWTARAAAIPDPSVRELACGKLRVEHFNAEVAATLATLAPKEHRRRAVEAIVAFEVLYDYLDGLNERMAAIEGAAGPGRSREGPVERGERLYRPFTAVFAPSPETDGPWRPDPALDDGGYAAELAQAARRAVAGLPSLAAIAGVAEHAARRCAEAQVRVHASSCIGTQELERWARARAAEDGGLDWRGYVAGSVASVLCVHALIAAATEPGLGESEARAVDRAYLHVSALSTLLDSLVDYERDVRYGVPWLARLYGGPEPLGRDLGAVARTAMSLIRGVRHPGHHAMTLLGVVAYYTSAPDAAGEVARAPFARLHRELRPVILPTLAVLRSWRLAKLLRGHWTSMRRARRARARRR